MTTWMIWLGQDLEQAVLYKWELGELKSQGEHSLSDMASTLSGEPVAVFFPAQHVSFIETFLPKTNDKKLRMALPALVEDEIASPPENNFYVLPNNAVSGCKETVAIIHLEYLQSIVEACQQVSLNITSLAPDCFLLPLPTDGAVKYIVNNRVIIRKDLKTGLALTTEHAALLMKELDTMKTAQPGLYEPAPYNFLQAQFKPAAPKKALGKLAWVYIALGGLFALHFISLIIVGSVLGARLDAVKAQNLALFDKVFPGSKKISSPKVLIDRELQKYGGGSFDPIFNMLTDLSQALLHSPGAVLNTLDYTPGRLTASLTLPGMQVLDQLNQSLNTNRVRYEQEVNEHDNTLSVKLDILQGEST